MSLAQFMNCDKWPGLNEVAIVDESKEFDENISGLSYQSKFEMYTVMRLLFNYS